MRRALFILCLLPFVAGCGAASEPRDAAPAAQEPPVQAGLVFRRADGSEIEMPEKPVAWCGPDDGAPGTLLQISTIMAAGHTPEEWFSYWHLWAYPDEVRDGAPVSISQVPPETGAWMFVGDSPTQNEASTNEQGSSGQIVFSNASCEVGAPVEFKIDAVVDSEFIDGEPVTVEGTFRGVLAEPPAGLLGEADGHAREAQA